MSIQRRSVLPIAVSRAALQVILVCGVLLAASTPSHARELLATLPTGVDPAYSPQLSQGLTAFLAKSPQFSLFSQVVTKVEDQGGIYGDLFEVLASNQTILLVGDGEMRSGFASLATQFNIGKPGTFIDRLIASANATYIPPDQQDFYETHGGTTSPGSNEVESYLILQGFLSAHIIEGAYNFYANNSILTATKTAPVNVSTTEQDPSGNMLVLQAYGQRNSSGQQTVYLTAQADAGLQPDDNNVISKAQPGPIDAISLTHTKDGVLVYPVSTSSGLNAINGTALEYVWQVGGIFVGNLDALPADASIACPKFEGSCNNPYGALQYLALNKF
ncbi:hypothetical protein WJX73_006884 [Symbiochloris irregularis]|uniref:Uncharacterized protein n=1 Tax=Symbiochloris irregularis TaxID=706552 RepID=A0AAW1NZ93_9CHLO